MRLCADENIPGDCVTALRLQGHDVVWMSEAMPGASDERVIAHAADEQRLLLTLVKDFGELVFHRGKSGGAGIVLFRITRGSAGALAEMVVQVLASRGGSSGHFSVVDDRTVRMRALKQL